MGFDHGNRTYLSRPGEREPRVSSQSPEVNNTLRSSFIIKVAERLREMGAEEFLQQHPLEARGTLIVPPVNVVTPDAVRYFNIRGEQFTPSILVVSDPSLRGETGGHAQIHSLGKEGMNPDTPRLALTLTDIINEGRNTSVRIQLPRAGRSSWGGAPYLYIGYDGGFDVPAIYLGPNMPRAGVEAALLMFAQQGREPKIAPLGLEDGWRSLFDKDGRLIPERLTSSARPEPSNFAHTMDRIDPIMGTLKTPVNAESPTPAKEIEEFSIRDQVLQAIQRGIEESGVITKYDLTEDAYLAPLRLTTNRVAEQFRVDGKDVTPGVIALSRPYGRTTHRPGTYIVMDDKELQIHTSLSYAIPATIQVARRDDTLFLQQKETDGTLSTPIDLIREGVLLLTHNEGALSLVTTVAGITLPEGFEQAFDSGGKLIQSIGEAGRDNVVTQVQFSAAGQASKEKKPGVQHSEATPDKPQKSPVEIALEQYLSGKMGMKDYLAIKHKHEQETGQSGYRQQPG